MAIQKNIFTIWFNESNDYPQLIRECVDSQIEYCKNYGYEHHLITLDNLDCPSRYAQDAIKAKKWTKASDYIRMWYLYTYSGIFLDSDMKMLPGKSFDKILQECAEGGYTFFTSKEVEGMYANSACGMESGHPLIGEYLRRLDDNFKGDGDMIFEPGIRAFCDLMWIADLEAQHIKIYPTEYFYPYDPHREKTNITENTILIHYYNSTKTGGWK